MSNMIAAFAFQPEIWLIFGLILIMLELTDGSTIFFLPLGLSAGLMAGWLYLINHSVIPANWQPPVWYFTILQWILLALIITIALASLKRIRGRSGTQSSDINDY